MTSIDYLTLEVPDLAAAEQFYARAFGLDSRVRFRESDAATSGFRGFHISLIASQPANVQALFDAAVAAGATTLKPAEKGMWGFGGVVQAPDGTIWKLATSNKKDTGPASREIDEIVLLLGVDDVGATKRFYVDRGLVVGKSFGKYVEFSMPSERIGFGLLGRKALAKDAGVSPEGSGSHRLVIAGDAGAFSDPDGFVWEASAD
jgi:catechol 2,3-dioxygenase-like lactoylglutathione lyase family enzyme